MSNETKPVWLRNMNPEQVEAILHTDGPCALLAQAGSGKTRALVHRIARLVEECHVDPAHILAVTFSKKAADEMNERLEDLGIEDARVGTWHSLCLEIIKTDATVWSTWTIDDRDAAKWAVKDAMGFKHLKWNGGDLTKVRKFIGICKANLWTWESEQAIELAQQEFGVFRDIDGRPAYFLALEAFRISQEILEDKGILTFDDFLVFTHRHLSDEATRERWAGKWRYFLQDEAQDANFAQVAIARLLAKDHRNYMVVGDVAQAIYGFRGSKPEYLATFAKEWDAKVIVMNKNYRSCPEIVTYANDVIRPAAIRIETDMEAMRESKGNVRVVGVENFDAEAVEFATFCEHVEKTGGHLSDITCLFRLNAQSRALEEELLKRRIPYVIVGGTSFYERREVKDLLSYLRVAVDRDREGDAVKRCINAPFRFLGTAFVDKLMDAARAHRNGDIDWPELVEEVAAQTGMQSRQRQSARGWSSLIRWVTDSVANDCTPAEILDGLVKTTGYIAWLEKEEGEESIESSGAANVRELIRVAERFKTVDELLTYIEKNLAAAKKQRRDKQAGGARVLLMSIHRSKGLEWPHVWIVGANRGVLPHHKGDLEEERRLMYVAVTRGRESVTISYVRDLVTRTGIARGVPSPFLQDAGSIAAGEFGAEA